MPYNRLSTAKIAKAVGCHPNTVRMYEQWGLLPPVPRSRSGYRLYTEDHLDQMRLARMVYGGDWPGREVRHSALKVVRAAAESNLGGALELAYQHLSVVQAEQAQAESAVNLLERWAQGVPADATPHLLHIQDAARLLGLTVDQLRSWERNSLLDVPRDPHNRYRLYGQPEIARLRIIRMLRSAGYSPISILRMLTRLDKGETHALRQALDTPDPQEDVYSAADHWLTTLADQEKRAREMITLVEERIRKRIKK